MKCSPMSVSTRRRTGCTRSLSPSAYTGARRSELLRARIEDFDFENRVVTLREKKKSRTKVTLRTVDMTPPVESVMREYLASRTHPGGAYAFCIVANTPISDGTSRKKPSGGVMRKSKRKVLRGYHVFRHSFASNLAAAGIDEHVISALMGVLTAEMRARYRHLFPQQRRTAAASVRVKMWRTGRIRVQKPNAAGRDDVRTRYDHTQASRMAAPPSLVCERVARPPLHSQFENGKRIASSGTHLTKCPREPLADARHSVGAINSISRGRRRGCRAERPQCP